MLLKKLFIRFKRQDVRIPGDGSFHEVVGRQRRRHHKAGQGGSEDFKGSHRIKSPGSVIFSLLGVMCY